MPKQNVKPTTAGSLEARFDAGEDVLDYFDLRTVRVVVPAAAMTPSIGELKRAIRLAQEIQRLESELHSLLRTPTNALPSGAKRDAQAGSYSLPNLEVELANQR